MDVRLPDGTVVQGVPENITRAELTARLQRNGMAVPADWARQSSPDAQKPAFEDPGALQSTLIGAGRTFDRIIKGVQQLGYGITGNDDAAAKLKAQAAADDAAYKPLQEARPWATGIGESLPSMIAPGGGGATLLQSAGRMALAGALPGALEYGDTGERLMRGAIGGAAGAAAPLLGAAAKTGKSLVEPLYQRGRETIAGRVLNRAAGDQAPAVRAALDQATELIPRSAPTAAQVANSGGIAALERAMSAANPEAYTRRAMEQSSARLNALRGIAKDAAAMAQAVGARDAASGALYAQADQAIVPIDGFFNGLQARPQFKAAVNRAQELAKNEGLSDIFFRGAKGEPVAMLGQGAHYIKKALDEAAERGADSYTGQAGAAAAKKTQAAFLDWLDKSVPEYGAAKAAFADASRPINQMQIGQELLNKVQPALADYGALGRENAAAFARALRDADATAARATGFPGATLSSVMEPGQMQTLQNVAMDLGRKANAQDLGRGVGSDTFQKLALQNIAQQSGAPASVGGLLSLPGISRATGWLYRDSDQQMGSLLAEALLNPKKAAKLMDDSGKTLLQNNPGLRQLLEQTLMRGGGLLGAAGTNPAPN